LAGINPVPGPLGRQGRKAIGHPLQKGLATGFNPVGGSITAAAHRFRQGHIQPEG
jgi:hypothetical protein